jgi:hypothetical protein
VEKLQQQPGRCGEERVVLAAMVLILLLPGEGEEKISRQK